MKSFVGQSIIAAAFTALALPVFAADQAEGEALANQLSHHGALTEISPPRNLSQVPAPLRRGPCASGDIGELRTSNCLDTMPLVKASMVCLA